MSTEGRRFESRSWQQSALYAKVQFSFMAVPYKKLMDDRGEVGMGSMGSAEPINFLREVLEPIKIWERNTR